MLLKEKLVYPSHNSVRNAPVNIIEQDLVLFKHEYQSSIGPTYLLEIKNAYILEDTVFDLLSFRFFASYTHINGSFSKLDKLKKLKLFFKSQASIDRGIWITQNWTWMYFHWMTDALTRLIAIENEVEKRPVLLPISYKAYPYIIESLDFLGYDYIWYSPSKPFRVKNLTLPSHTSSPGNYNGVFLNQLRTKFINNNTSAFRKIFITRSEAKQRFLKNEKEVVDIVKSFGFEIHVFEHYSLQKQIKLMNETTCLLGLHGAGLTNMLFMPQNGTVMELRNHGDKHNNCYFSMASELNHSYYYLQGKGDSENTAEVNLQIDTIQLTNLLLLVSTTKK